MPNPAYPRLFSPIAIHTMTLKNRVVMPPMCTAYATIGGAVTDRMIDYYTARARGGVGLIDVEFTYVHPSGKIFDHMLGIYDDSLVPGLRRLTDSVHAAGGKIAIQIAHAGRRTHSDITGMTTIAPSALPRLNGETPRELSLPEVEELIQQFIDAARRAKQANFDAVMIHMAHGYLIQQFLSPLSNRRTDEYGGDFDRRARFALEVLRGFRAELGKDYPITCRLCGDEYVKGGFDLGQSVRLSRTLEAEGINAIEVSAGTHETPEMMGAPPYYPMGFLGHLSQATKKEVSIPVGIVGRIHTPEVAERLLEEGQADLIAVGRGLIADPEWAQKARDGQAQRICPCISCNQGCSDRMYYQQDVSCTVNPAAGLETAYPPKPAGRKKILTIGGGPAGLEAARTAALRGHEVQLWEEREELGGQLNLASVPPGKEDIARFRDFLVREVKGLPIEIRRGKPDARAIKKFSPDLVLAAAGGRPKELRGPQFRGGSVSSAWEVLAGRAETGARVVIIGGGQVGLETAHFLLQKGKSIIILEMLKKAGQDMSSRARKVILPKLVREGVEILTESKAVSFEGNAVVYDRAGVIGRVKADSIVIAVGTDPAGVKVPGLKKSARTRLVGDANGARGLFEAMHEGYNAAMEA